MTSDSSPQPTGLDIALQWSQLPPEHLQAALKALEPQLAREHEYRMAMLHAQTEGKRALIKHLIGLAAGFVIATGTMIAAVILGINNQTWLALALTGPSLIALVTIFVLRKSTAADLKELRRAQGAAQSAIPAPMSATGTGQPPLV